MEKDTSKELHNLFFFNDMSLKALFKKNDTVFNTNKIVCRISSLVYIERGRQHVCKCLCRLSLAKKLNVKDSH